MARGRVLIIEQEEWEATLLSKFLSEAGYEVHVAGEARAGFDKVRELQPDCILCSVNLPDIDGFELLNRISSDERLRDLPVIVYTAKELTSAEITKLSAVAKTIVLLCMTW